jgi:hypothetical protein
MYDVWYMAGWKIAVLGYTWDIFKCVPSQDMRDFVTGYISGLNYKLVSFDHRIIK